VAATYQSDVQRSSIFGGSYLGFGSPWLLGDQTGEHLGLVVAPSGVLSPSLRFWVI
jgi:hypothetical protein